MLGGAGEAHRKWLGELADRFVAKRETGEHSTPRRIGQCAEGRIKSFFNHVVELQATRYIVNQLV